MYIEKYVKSRHIKYIQRWLKERSIDDSFCESLPELGYVAYIEDFPIACGFLRRCEGNLGIIDSFCTNPKMPGKLRHEAQDLITKKLIMDSKQLELKGLIAFSSNDSIINRSLRHNFRKLDQTVMTLRLSE